jgi:hypothetical protein
MSSHGARSNTRNNLWIVYSYKVGMDISLASNREVIYWLADIEINPKIDRFEFGYRANLKFDNEEKKFRSVEVIKVDYIDHVTEFHYLSSGNGQIKSVNLPCRDCKGREYEVRYIQIHEDYLATKARLTSRLLHINSFAAQIREGAWSAETNQICNLFQIMGHGTIKCIVDQCSALDPMVTIGICSRIILSGQVVLDLEGQGFGYHSYWRLS